MATASPPPGSASSNDPLGLLSGASQRQPAIVKVSGTAREDMNNALGIVVQYTEGRGRYLVHLVKNQTTVALKPENLQKASYIEQLQAQYQQLTNDPRVRNEINRVLNMVETKFLSPYNISIKQAGLGLVGILLSSIFLLGISKTILILSFMMIIMLVIGPDLANNNADIRTIIKNIPDRFATVIEQHFPGGHYIAKNKILVAAMGAFLIFVFLKGVITSPPRAALSPPSMDTPVSPVLPPSTGGVAVDATSSSNIDNMQEFFYKLGFEDAAAQKDYGESLKAQQEQRDGGMQLNIQFDDFDQDIITGRQTPRRTGDHIPPQGPPMPQKSSSKFGFGTMMSMFYIYRTVMDLGKDANSQWSFDLLKNNLMTLEPWRLGMLGFSVFALFRSLFF